MSEIVMPRLSDTMEEGTILRWLKGNGEHVARGEELVEIETDKAAMTYESDLEGALQIVAEEGQTLPVGAVIAYVGQPAAKAVPSASPDAGAADAAAAPGETATSPDAVPAAQTPAAAGPDAGGERVKASPLARRVALERGVELRGLSGSGPGGRIVKADVVGSAAEAPAPSASEAVATAKGTTTTVELTRAQQTVARRMAESKATIPDFSIQIEVDMEECVALRSELKRLAPADAGSEAATLGSPTYNDMVVKASALALREHPHANGSYRDGRLQLHSRVNVGVAVAAQDALVVATVFDADEKSLGEIARETRTLADRVRTGAITPPELGGGTFTVSNLGMYGVRSFTAIINPPQAAILSVGSLERRAVVVDGGAGGAREIVARSTMMLTLVCDHRILYGAEAARFAARIRELLQAPAALTL
jgi:pyruvate dehydrogenase E2 component (dihydrolipoamide acetyltransferase)